MILKGDIGYLEFNILSTKTLGSNDFWEENWLYTLVEARFPGFTANYKCYLRTDDLKRWYDDIIDMINEKTNHILFTTLEEGVELSLEKETFGNIAIRGKLMATELTGCKLEFNFITDMSTLENFHIQLYHILNKYPIIGSES